MGSNESAYQLLSERLRDKKEGEHRAGSLGEGRADNVFRQPGLAHQRHTAKSNWT